MGQISNAPLASLHLHFHLVGADAQRLLPQKAFVRAEQKKKR